MADENNIALFDGDPQAGQREDSKKQGTSSWKGILGVYGEFQFAALTERRMREKIGEDQLVLPMEWWIMTKGAVAFGGACATVLLMLHLATAAIFATYNWPDDIRTGVMIFFISSSIYWVNNHFLMKTRYADGMVTKFYKLLMIGFTGHMFMLKLFMCGLALFLTTMHVNIGEWLLQNVDWLWVYKAWMIIVLPAGTEWLLFGAAVFGIAAAQHRRNLVFKDRRNVAKTGRVYDLLTSAG